MKLNNTIVKAILIITIAIFSLANHSKAQISKIELKATGLTCSMCSNAIFKQLKSMPEVESIKTDLNNNAFIISIKNGFNISPTIFKTKVEDAGFFVGSFIVMSTSEILQKNNYILVEGKASKLPEIKFQVVDKGFVTEKEYKKLSKLYKHISTYGTSNGTNFHIKILS